MQEFKIHSSTSAPTDAREPLEQVSSNFGFIPNVLAVMAGAPPLLKGYLAISNLFDQTSLTPTERQVVLLSVSHENSCHYCMAAHTVVAEMSKVPAEVIEALRDDRPIADSKLEALRRFTKAVVKSRGMPMDQEVTSFLEAGYSQANILEVILGVGMKTMSNYINHIADTPLDEAFAPKAWQAAG
jgi:uncharacterized peroxidase-related enzyme